jgi:hypothetical protein
MAGKLTDRNRAELENRGYTVVPGVLTEDECHLYIQVLLIIAPPPKEGRGGGGGWGERDSVRA